MRFSVNGSDQGVAFRVAKARLQGRALFPHILTKNQVRLANVTFVFNMLRNKIYLVCFTFSELLICKYVNKTFKRVLTNLI